jgi:hypothetical protein
MPSSVVFGQASRGVAGPVWRMLRGNGRLVGDLMVNHAKTLDERRAIGVVAGGVGIGADRLVMLVPVELTMHDAQSDLCGSKTLHCGLDLR